MADPVEDPRDEELRKLRKINRVLMDRVEGDMDARGIDAYSLFRTAITLEGRISERVSELTQVTLQLRHEISQRKQAEKALIAARAEAEEANISKTRFLAAAAHDLYQPLNAARLFLGSLAEEVQSERSRQLVSRSEASLDAVDDLLGTLLDISRLDAGVWPVKITDLRIDPLLERLADDYRPQAAAAGLQLRVVQSDAVILTDRTLFERLLRNLISNAIRYTAEGRVLVGCRRHGGQLWVEVWDSGIGIPEKQRRRVFEEFQRLGNEPRRDDKGHGLGLAIVDRISKLLGVKVNVISTVGKGSCFAVSVPFGDPVAESMAAKEAIAAEAASDVIPSDPKCVVVIDNDSQSLAAVAEVIRSWNWRAVEADTAAGALAELVMQGVTPDLIVADYHLDCEALGTDAIEEIRRVHGADLPAMIMSGDRSVALRSALRERGYGYLAKPMRPARLRTLLNYLVETGE